jgi:hypothetical protein
MTRTALSPRDPADESARRISTRVMEKIITNRLREIEASVERKTKERDDADR